MMDGQIVETSKAMLARHRVAIEGLTWDEAGVIEAARQVLLGVWPERGADDDYLSEFTEGVLHSDSVAYGLVVSSNGSRASWVLNLQWIVAPAALRSLTRAWTSPRSASSSGSRVQAGAGQHAELNLGHVQPTAVLGGVVELQNPPGLRRRERLVQGRCGGCSGCP